MIIACRERGWFEEGTEDSLWTNLCRSAGTRFELVDTLDDVPELVGTIVVMDETGDESLENFAHPEDAVYIFGNSGNTGIQQHIRADHVVRIDTPHDCNMFGISAASMVLYDRMVKNGN